MTVNSFLHPLTTLLGSHIQPHVNANIKPANHLASAQLIYVNDHVNMVKTSC